MDQNDNKKQDGLDLTLDVENLGELTDTDLKKVAGGKAVQVTIGGVCHTRTRTCSG